MIIYANGHQIEAFSAYDDSIIRGTKTYPSIVIRLFEMPTAEQLSALTCGDIVIEGTNKVGYTHLANLSLTLYQMSDEAQQVEQLTEQVQTKTAKLLNIATALPDEIAIQHTDIYPEYAVGMALNAGDRIREGGVLYRVIQPHTTQADWPPATTASLYTRINAPDEPIPEWVSGTSHDLGARVTHGGKTWESMVPNNVWEPGAEGVYDNIWREVAQT